VKGAQSGSGVTTIEQVTNDLHQLGIVTGDLVMVHASMRSVGPVEGGAAGLINALDRIVGHNGTVVMNLGALDEWTKPIDQSDISRAGPQWNAVPFDCFSTPTDPDNGVLAEAFRISTGTRVSDHPEGRFGARGRLAAALLHDVPWDHYYGPGSTLQRFVEYDGRVLRLGADLETVTLIHYAEYLCNLPNKRAVQRTPLIITPSGPTIRTVQCLDDTDGIAEYPGEDYFATITRSYLATGRASIGKVGDAPSELIDGADLVDFAIHWMNTNLR
jgi:aminoglycoside N3'-acetyltransferase